MGIGDNNGYNNFWNNNGQRVQVQQEQRGRKQSPVAITTFVISLLSIFIVPWPLFFNTLTKAMDYPVFMSHIPFTATLWGLALTIVSILELVSRNKTYSKGFAIVSVVLSAIVLLISVVALLLHIEGAMSGDWKII